MELQRWLYKLPLRLRSLFRRSRVERELDEEIRYHIERQTQELIAKGLTPGEARNAALRSMHGIEQRKEECRDTRGLRSIDHLVQDLRYGLRVTLKAPGYGFAVVATIALGIGATTAVFSVVYGIALRPLPYPQQHELVRISPVSIANYLDWRDQNSVFEEMGIIKLVQNFNITGDGIPERVLGGRSSASIFRVLGISPVLGRVFTEDDGQVEDKVVLSEELWKRRYRADPAIL